MHTVNGKRHPRHNTLSQPECVGYDDLSDLSVALQRVNEALNSSLRIVRQMETHQQLQQALQDLRVAVQRIIYLTAVILTVVLDDGKDRN